MGFAIAMAVPIGVLGLMGRRSVSLVGRVADNYDVISKTAGVALLTLGLLLILNRPLIEAMDGVHHVLGA